MARREAVRGTRKKTKEKRQVARDEPEVPATAAEEAEPEAEQEEEHVESEAPEQRPRSLIPDIPSVCREQGYLALVVAQRAGEVLVIGGFAQKGKHYTFPQFNATFAPMPDLNPHHLALNFISRAHRGLFEMRAKDERRLVAMLSKEELGKLSERRLAEEYLAIMGTGPKRIRAEQKDERISAMIDEMVQKVHDDAAARLTDESAAVGAVADTLTVSPTQGETMVSVQTAGPAKKPNGGKKTAKPAVKAKAPANKKASTKNGTTAEAKRPSPVAKAAKKAPKAAGKPAKKGAPKAPRAPRVKKEAWAKGENRYRATSIKHHAFNACVEAKGDREAYLKKAEKLNITPGTAKSWFLTFVKEM